MVPQILVGILVLTCFGGLYFGVKEINWLKNNRKK